MRVSTVFLVLLQVICLVPLLKASADESDQIVPKPSIAVKVTSTSHESSNPLTQFQLSLPEGSEGNYFFELSLKAPGMNPVPLAIVSPLGEGLELPMAGATYVTDVLNENTKYEVFARTLTREGNTSETVLREVFIEKVTPSGCSIGEVASFEVEDVPFSEDVLISWNCVEANINGELVEADKYKIFIGETLLWESIDGAPAPYAVLPKVAVSGKQIRIEAWGTK